MNANGVDTTIVNPAPGLTTLARSGVPAVPSPGRGAILARGRPNSIIGPDCRWIASSPTSCGPRTNVPKTSLSARSSRCMPAAAFNERGDAKLGCISCHDPHALPAPEQRDGFFRDRCLDVSRGPGCSLPAARGLEKISPKIAASPAICPSGAEALSTRRSRPRDSGGHASGAASFATANVGRGGASAAGSVSTGFAERLRRGSKPQSGTRASRCGAKNDERTQRPTVGRIGPAALDAATAGDPPMSPPGKPRRRPHARRPSGRGGCCMRCRLGS